MSISSGYEIAALSTGGLLSAIDAVMTKQITNAYCLIRPPGTFLIVSLPITYALAVEPATSFYVFSSKLINRFVGHHAIADKGMGFCVFNNIVIGAQYARKKYSDIVKVAIVDYDVHHGNGKYFDMQGCKYI